MAIDTLTPQDLKAHKAHKAQVRLQSMRSQSRADWVDVQLTRNFFANSRTALLAAMAALVTTVYVLVGAMPTYLLAGWAVLVAGMTLYRHQILKIYFKNYSQSKAVEVNAYFQRQLWTWPLSAVVWAGLMFSYLEKVPMTSQFICMLVLVGMGAFSVTLMSARLDCFRWYINALCLTCALAVISSWYRDGVWTVQSFDVAMMVLIVAFWGLVMRSGHLYHAVQRRGYELQYDNEGLIASLREQTDMAKQAVIVKNRLLANAAHDLRQPVHALAFYADWLRNEPDLAAEVVPKILLATDSVNTLFNSLFDFAKIEAGGVQPHFAAVPVCELVNDMKVQFSPAAITRQIEFRQRITPGYVRTDPILIRRIMGNLLANAIYHTDRGGVLLSTRLRGQQMWIEVWDTGVGIAYEHQAWVFKEFYKAPMHQGTEQGFGLGLAIVERLASVLGHKVVLSSQPGRGTCMRVIVDLAPAPQSV